MNCRQVERILGAYVAGELSEETAAGVRGHLGECAGCRANEAEYRDALAALREEGSQAIAPDARFFRQLSARLDDVDRIAGRRRVQPIRWYFVGSVAAAAAAVFILAVYVIPNLGPQNADQPPATIVAESPDVSPETGKASSGPSWDTRYMPVSSFTGSRYAGPGRAPGAVFVDPFGGQGLPGERTFFVSESPSLRAEGFVTLEEHRKLENKLREVEARLAVLEQVRPSGASE